MNKVLKFGVGVVFLFGLIYAGEYIYKSLFTKYVIPEAPKKTFQYKEILVKYNEYLPKAFGNLTPQERIFVYYLLRASLPCKRIMMDQMNRNGLEIFDLFKLLVKNEEMLKHSPDFKNLDLNEFMKQARTYLVYLHTNYGQYFQREQGATKRTPARLGLDLVTEENMVNIFKALNLKPQADRVHELAQNIFDENFESTRTVPGSIEKSAVNFYSEDFTDDDYKRLSDEDKAKLAVYFSIEKNGKKRGLTQLPYAIGGKYSDELSIAVPWLQRAYEHAKNYPVQFDKHLVMSLDLLIKFFQTGNETFFRQHSIEWLQSESRVDYCFGFIETYDDPMSRRGTFQADVTVKKFDLKKIKELLPKIEQQLPLPDEFKRVASQNGNAPILNVAICEKIFGLGHLGPLKITAAYCLPNYDDIRALHGSKQIVYPATKTPARLLNPKLYRTLFFPKEQASWLDATDPADNLFDDLWNVQCILHETIGHGSGRLVEGLDRNSLKEYSNTFEELRAEIIALYVSTKHLDEIIASGLLDQWHDKMSFDELREQMILHMCYKYFLRLMQQSDDAVEINGDHARDNSTIVSYLVEQKAVKFVEEVVSDGGVDYDVIGFDLVDVNIAMSAIESLMIKVQTIKSTGDFKQAKELIQTRGIKLNQKYFQIIKHNLKAVAGDVKVLCMLWPKLEPITSGGKNSNLIDVKATWPTDIFDFYEYYLDLEQSGAFMH